MEKAHADSEVTPPPPPREAAVPAAGRNCHAPVAGHRIDDLWKLHALINTTYIQPCRLQFQLHDINSHLGQPQPTPLWCSWGTQVGSVLSLCGILGRLGFHGPYQIPCAGMSPRGNVWHPEGTGSSCAMTGGSCQLNTAMPQFIWIKNKSPVSHRASGTLSLERQNGF